MPKFEVTILYTGVSTYLVEADNREAAEEKARVRHLDAGVEDPTCSEWEDIVETRSAPFVEGTEPPPWSGGAMGNLKGVMKIDLPDDKTEKE